MPHVEWTPRAEKNLEDIALYIGVQDSRPISAFNLVDAIHAKANQYAHQPLMGTPRPDLGEDFRCFTHKRYVVVYIPLADGIRVLAVIDGARDYGLLFE